MLTVIKWNPEQKCFPRPHAWLSWASFSRMHLLLPSLWGFRMDLRVFYWQDVVNLWYTPPLILCRFASYFLCCFFRRELLTLNAVESISPEIYATTFNFTFSSHCQSWVTFYCLHCLGNFDLKILVNVVLPSSSVRWDGYVRAGPPVCKGARLCGGQWITFNLIPHMTCICLAGFEAGFITCLESIR